MISNEGVRYFLHPRHHLHTRNKPNATTHLVLVGLLSLILPILLLLLPRHVCLAFLLVHRSRGRLLGRLLWCVCVCVCVCVCA